MAFVYLKQTTYFCQMFIRQVKKQNSKNGQTFYQYSLIQAMRENGKPRQRTVLYLGSDERLRDKNNREAVLRALVNLIYNKKELFAENIPGPLKDLAEEYYLKYKIKYQGVEDPINAPPPKDDTVYERVAVDEVSTSDSRSFGPEHLCLQTLEKLGVASILSKLGFSRDEVDKALISITARAIYGSSEYKTAQILEMNSSLKECLGYEETITHKQLYRVADLLYENKEIIERDLYARIKDLFSIEDSIVIFDISNTYFEPRKAGSRLANYGRSKEKRYDCPIVVFTGVINSDGFIRHSRIYEGNQPDGATTLSDMIADLEKYSGSSEKTVVIDAGIATDENLLLLDKKGYKYVCVSRKRLKDYPVSDLQERIIRKTDRGHQEVRLSIFQPEGYTDTWMYVESDAKSVKETSMRRKLRSRFEVDLGSIKDGLHKKGGTKKIDKVWERIGRYKQKHHHVSGSYIIKVKEENGKATEISWEVKTDKVRDDKNKGVYFIRTNMKKISESLLWSVYNTIRNVESTFRCLKSDLHIRPVHHQKDGRIESHLYLAILAYQLVNTIRHMLKEHDIHYDWRNIVRIMSTQQLQTIELPTETKIIKIRQPSKPIMEVGQIYRATNCKETQKSLKKYVVYH